MYHASTLYLCICIMKTATMRQAAGSLESSRRDSKLFPGSCYPQGHSNIGDDKVWETLERQKLGTGAFTTLCFIST
jgi:hypothetical protein